MGQGCLVAVRSHRPWWPQHGLAAHLLDQGEVAGRNATQRKPGVLCQFEH